MFVDLFGGFPGSSLAALSPSGKSRCNRDPGRQLPRERLENVSQLKRLGTPTPMRLSEGIPLQDALKRCTACSLERIRREKHRLCGLSHLFLPAVLQLDHVGIRGAQTELLQTIPLETTTVAQTVFMNSRWYAVTAGTDRTSAGLPDGLSQKTRSSWRQRTSACFCHRMDTPKTCTDIWMLVLKRTPFVYSRQQGPPYAEFHPVDGGYPETSNPFKG